MSKRLLLSAAFLPMLALTACGDGAEEAGAGSPDAASEQALNDQIMVDSDLANQNEGNAAITGGSDQTIPAENMTPEAIQAAKDAAFALVGGSDGVKKLPEALQYRDTVPEDSALTAATQSAAKLGNGDCAKNVKYSAQWAAKLPSIFPVYPRGATKEAAGTDYGDCALRAVTYLTPVSLGEVLTFYNSRALTGGYSSEYAIAGGDNVLSGTKGKSAFVIYGRKLPNGLTEIDLITSGK